MQAVLKVVKGDHGVNKTYWLRHNNAKGLVVFFGGDRVTNPLASSTIQTLQDPKQQAQVLHDKFRDHTVVVVLPSREEAGFVCFDHFLEDCSATGEPSNTFATTPIQGFSEYKSCSQLQSLIEGGGPAGVIGLPWSLVGFSKGGTVINQVLCELSCWSSLRQHHQKGETPSQGMPKSTVHSFMQQLRDVHFLDVGLNTTPAYIIREDVIKPLRWLSHHQQMRIILHGTPYQWDNVRKPHQLASVDKFERLLRQARVPCIRYHYFEDNAPSLEMHFNVIQQMRLPQDNQ